MTSGGLRIHCACRWQTTGFFCDSNFADGARACFCPFQSLSRQLLAWRKQLMPHAWRYTWAVDLTGIDLFLFLALAIIGGILGALFNHIVEHLNHLRAHHVNRSALLRSLEVLVSPRTLVHLAAVSVPIRVWTQQRS
jgi:hypothetical protein